MPFAAYYRSILSENERRAYDAITNGMYHLEKSIKLPDTSLSSERLNALIFAVKYDNPQLYYVDFSKLRSLRNNLSLELQVEYYYDQKTIRDIAYRLRLKTVTIMKETEGKSVEEKMLILHDWLAAHCTYGNTEQYPNATYNILGAFLSGRCVCEGYAMAYKYLADLARFYCAIVCGEGVHPDGTSGNHAWNLVNLDHSNYHIDVTFDHLVAGKFNSRAYYLLSTKEILYDHRIDDLFKIPDCPKSRNMLKTVYGTLELIAFLESEYRRNASHSEVRLSRGFETEALLAMIEKRVGPCDYKWMSRIDAYWYGDYSKTLFVTWK